MGKVIKNVVKTLVAAVCVALLVAIVLPLAASLALSVPRVQNAIVHRLTARLSEKLGTRVSIERIDIKSVNHVAVTGFYVEDHSGDTLLYVPRLSAPIVEAGIGKEPLTFGRVKLEGARMQLHRDSLGVLNIRQLVAAIREGRPPNPDPQFRMIIQGIDAEDITFGLRLDDGRRREKGVDFSRFEIRNTKVGIDGLEIAGDTVRIDIRKLRFDERSGFGVDNIEVRDLVVSRGEVALSNVRIAAPGADLDVPEIRIGGVSRNWRTFRHFNDSIDIGVAMRRSRFSAEFLGRFLPHFLPVAEGRELFFEDVSVSTTGPLSAFSGRIDNVSALGTEVSLDFTSRGLPRLDDARFGVNISRVSTSAGDLDSLIMAMTGSGLPEKIMAMLERAGGIGFTGNASGGLSDIVAEGTLSTDAGTIDIEAGVSNGRGGASSGRAVASGRAGMSVDGKLSTRSFALGRVAARSDLGDLSGEFGMKGSFEGRKFTWGEVAGEISELGFGGYKYGGIAFDGTFDEEGFEGAATSGDPALDAEVRIAFDGRGAVPQYDMEADIRKADLAATGLAATGLAGARVVGGDSVSLLSGRLSARFSGTGLDDANGLAELRDASYTSAYGSVSTPAITLSARSSPTAKLLSLGSEFVDAEFGGRTGYRDMFVWLGSFLQNYIPRIDYDEARRPDMLPDTGVDPADRTNYSIVSVKIKDSERLSSVLAPGTGVAPGSEVNFMFNPFTGGFSLSASSDYIEYGGILAENITLGADNSADSLAVHLSSSDIYSESMHIPGFVLHGGAKGRGSVDISLDGRVWHVRTDSLAYGTGRVAVEGLRVFSASDPMQRLTANGVVSRLPTDTLHVALDRFDLSGAGKLLSGGRLPVEGRATGRLDVAALAGNPRIDALVDLDAVSLGATSVAPLRVESYPEGRTGGVRFEVSNLGRGVRVLSGSLSDSGEIDAVLDAESVDVALLDPLLGSVLENTSGRADVRLDLGGTIRNPRIEGRVDIPHFETTVGYTKARYTLTDGEMTVENSRMVLPPTIVRDAFGGEGDLSVEVDLSRPGNVAVELDARMRGLAAIDTDAGDNEAFYGRLFATGSLGLSSDRMGTRMNISARTDPGSRIHLPLSAGSDVSWADFVVFTDPSQETLTADPLSGRRQAYRRRIAGAGGGSVRRRPFELDLTVSATPDAEVHLVIDPDLGEGITAAGEGILSLRVNPSTDLFSMSGDYVIRSGRFEFSMMDVFNKDFVIVPGSSLQWTGSPDDALLDVEASYRVRTSLLPLIGESGALISGRAAVPVDCILQIGGRLSEPEITFDITLPSADPDARLIVNNAMNTQELKSMQFLSLLTTGTFASDNSITGQTTNSGVMATGAVGFDILTNQLNNFLSSEDWDVYFRYRPQDNFLSNQFDVGFSTGFIDDRLMLEIEGNYVDDRAAMSVGASGASNLAGDVSLTWVIDKAGNLRLKVFSQTIDRLNETQGLQESGLGIYYRKDFDRFGDIFRRKPAKVER